MAEAGLARFNPPTFWDKLMQTWPVRTAQAGLAALELPGDVYAGRATVPQSANMPGGEDTSEIGRVADLAGLVMGGTYAGAPAGAMGAGPVRRAASLPMDEASRMARAEELGFTTPAYHGTRSNFDEFSRIDGGNARGEGYYFSTSPDTASRYATGDVNRISLPGDADPNVMPVLLNTKQPFDENAMLTASQLRAIERAANKEGGEWKRGELLRAFDRAYPPTGSNVAQFLTYNADEQNAILRRAGYDSRIGHAMDSGSGARDIVVFEPNQIRSRFAAFDSANKKSGNLLGSVLAAAGLGSLAIPPEYMRARGE